MKEFITSAVNAMDDDDVALGQPVTVKIDGRKVKFRPPSSGQLAVFLAGASDNVDSIDTMSMGINFFFALLADKEDVRYFKVRLLDRDDHGTLDTIGEVVNYLVEEWTARPTSQPSASLPSQPSDGPRLTAQVQDTVSIP